MNLQEIRTRQAAAEVGILNPVIKIDHKRPVTRLNEITKTLIFPKRILDYKADKDIDVIFIGQISESRKEFLAEIAEKYPGTVIIPSLNGRTKETKNWDESYFRKMSRAKFTACPAGELPWSYRFFEAVLLRAIPIVDEPVDIYEGYHFLRIGEPLEYDESMVERNLEKAKRELML